MLPNLLILVTLVTRASLSSTSNYTTTTSATGEDVDCKDLNFIKSCTIKLSAILNVTAQSGFPYTKEELNQRCTAFQTGVDCFDQYVDKCRNEKVKTFYYNYIARAKNGFDKICNDVKFQNEYFRHSVCLKGIQTDWFRCTSNLHYVTKNQMSKTLSAASNVVESCCAKLGFLRCIYAASRLKCNKEDAFFTKLFAEMFADIDVNPSQCGSIDLGVCSSNTTYNHIFFKLVIAGFTFVFVNT